MGGTRNFCTALSAIALLFTAAPALADMAPDPPEKQRQTFASPAEAMDYLLSRYADHDGQVVLAFGEYHETNADAKKQDAVPSALKRFSKDFLPLLSPKVSDIILETWITDGNCGKQESAAVTDVQKTTQRPVTTEDELVTLVKLAKASGVQPHILKLSCDNYQNLIASGDVDYEKLLKLLTELLQKKITDVAKARQKPGGGKHIVVYGGALHNDLEPKPELAAFSFGPAMRKQFDSGYVEIDLYVPEFVERDASLKNERWFVAAKGPAAAGKTVLVRRAAGSYILVFPRSGKR